MAVAVAHNGEIVWEQGFGFADREKGIKATPHTVYSLASVTKLLTATGLMALVQRGKIDLDRPVDESLGEAKIVAKVGEASQVTIRRIAGRRGCACGALCAALSGPRHHKHMRHTMSAMVR